MLETNLDLCELDFDMYLEKVNNSNFHGFNLSMIILSKMAPAIEPSFQVTDSSPTEEGHTPEQTPRKEDSESQPKVTISLTHSHTDRQTDRQITSDNGSFSIIAERQSI